MDIYEKVRRMRKHYKADPVRIENLLRSEIEASPDRAMLWSSLIFDGDIEYMTIGEKKAAAVAEKNGITSYEIRDNKVIGC